MTSTIEVRAPSEQTEGTRSQVQRWLKAVGQNVEENEPLIEVETDKVTIEIPAPASGVLAEILKQEQEDITPGELLGRISLGTAESASPVPQPVTTAAPPSRETPSPGIGRTTSAGGGLSPAVRRLLAERNLDASAVLGSGAGGRITVEDVLNHVASPAPAPAATPAATASAAATRASESTDSGIPSHRVPHSSMRKRIAERMSESLLHTAPHVTTVFEADLGAVMAHRERHKTEFQNRGVSLTFTAYFLSACVEAIRAVPEANSRWHANALEIYDTVDIGVGTAIENKGLVVPIVRSVQNLDLFGIAQSLSDLVARAREDKLTPADVRGGTFTISNHGVSGSLVATPIIINQPQSAILGIGKLEKRAVVVNEGGEDRVVVRPRCYVTLTLDHRVMDGHRANKFLSTFVATLENWGR